MKRMFPQRRPLGIAGKLRLGFGALLALLVLTMAAWLFSLHLANQARKTISAQISVEPRSPVRS